MKGLASGEKVVCLVSGGIDSPVAAWLMIRKGFIPVFIYFDNHPYTDEAARKRALDAVLKLCDYLPNHRACLYLVPHGENLGAVVGKCPRNLTCLLCKRLMYRMAELIAVDEDCEGIVTGEIMGEHASQTSRNLHVLCSALKTRLPVLRPLLGMDKTEVEDMARKIGTFTISISPAKGCSAFPRSPRTHASFKEITEAEKSLEIDLLIERSLAQREVKEVQQG